MRQTRLLTLAAVLALAVAPATVVRAGPPPPIVVNSAGNGADLNGGTGSCDASLLPGNTCTLRAAIQTANNDPDEDVITFAIAGAGPHVITLATELPAITEPLAINGYSQAGSQVNTATTGTNAKLKVVLQGSSGFNGLVALSKVRIRGLVIGGFASGILVGVGAAGSVLSGNFLGTTVTGMGLDGNVSHGVSCICDGVITVGGASKAARNIIAGNVIGVFGWLTPGSRLIVAGNLVGVGRDGLTNLGNAGSGIRIKGDGTARIGGDDATSANVIAYNDDAGVAVGFGAEEPTGITVARNSIYANGGLGIDLGDDGPTANDLAPDADDGPNHRQNFPGVTSAVTSGGVTRVKGALASVPGRTYDLRFYSTAGAGGGSGRTFLMKKRVFTKPNGKVAFSFVTPNPVPVGRIITVTATQQVTKDTSEFSVARVVTGG